MKHYFITGTSRGIGKSIAEILLKNDTVKITGISRTSTIKHKNYSHITTDLSDLNDTESIFFPTVEDAEEIVLINNSGIISEILRVGKMKNVEIINDYNVNIVSPSILMNNFIKKYQNYTNKRTILNISSGAGRHTIDAWSVYCASKAALDMFSKNIDIEQSFFSKKNQIKVFSVAPGVIDTEMQKQIRETSPSEFSNVEKFIDLKENNELATTEETANLLLDIINNKDNYTDVILDVRNL
ncbi:MAG: SDR family NAD(P)-dependent oxidoreductase [Bacteroidales bacterium]|nr:SDR family NAD(P)-dependent oxidoreductase [Bacteroidales bacterium]